MYSAWSTAVFNQAKSRQLLDEPQTPSFEETFAEGHIDWIRQERLEYIKQYAAIILFNAVRHLMRLPAMVVSITHILMVARSSGINSRIWGNRVTQRSRSLSSGAPEGGLERRAGGGCSDSNCRSAVLQDFQYIRKKVPAFLTRISRSDRW